jgi:hypothetical protein
MSEIGRIHVFDSANIAATDLEISHRQMMRPLEVECLGLYDDELRDDIERRRIAYDKPGSGQYDGTLLCFDGFSINGEGTRTLRLCDIKFSTYQALKTRLEREAGHEHTLTRLVPMISFAETSDDRLVFGHRSTQHMPDRYLPPAGFSIHDGQIDNHYFAQLAKEEIGEEVGMEIDQESVRYVGLTSGEDSRNNTVILHARLPCDIEAVERRFQELNQSLRETGKQIEHKHLIYLPNDLDSVTQFLCGKYSGDLNPMQGINFLNGACIEGPDEIRGKQYMQIGNGMSAVLSLMKERVSAREYSGLVGQVEKSRVVDCIEHSDINVKLDVNLR